MYKCESYNLPWPPRGRNSKSDLSPAYVRTEDHNESPNCHVTPRIGPLNNACPGSALLNADEWQSLANGNLDGSKVLTRANERWPKPGFGFQSDTVIVTYLNSQLIKNMIQLPLFLPYINHNRLIKLEQIARQKDRTKGKAVINKSSPVHAPFL